MTKAESSDVIVVGGGQAGPFLGPTLAAQGRKVALIEARELGGTCVNRGCTPTKRYAPPSSAFALTTWSRRSVW